MADDYYFQYTKLFVENFWIFALVAAMVVVAIKPAILDRVGSVKFANIEVVLRELKQEINETKETIIELKAVNEEYQSELDSLDINGRLGEARRAIKSIVASATDRDVASIKRGFLETAKPEEVFGAAVMARTRKDPALFDDLIACLSRIASDPDLCGLRLNIVWNLTSAVHLTLVAALKHRKAGLLSRLQLERAKKVLEQLVIHPKVEADRPEAPSKGITGPAVLALKWIDTGLKESTPTPR